MIGGSSLPTPEESLDKLAKHARTVLVVLAGLQLVGGAIMFLAGAIPDVAREPAPHRARLPGSTTQTCRALQPLRRAGKTVPYEAKYCGRIRRLADSVRATWLAAKGTLRRELSFGSC